MADESRFDREPAGRGYGRERDEYRGHDYGRGDYRGRDYGREDYGRGYRGEGYRDERDYAREGWSGLGYGREGAGYGQSGGFGYGHEGYGYGGGGYGRDDYGRRYGEGWRGAQGAYGRGRRGEERGFWDRASDEVSSWFGDEDAERRRQMDERREGAWHAGGGGHRGRGPRGYTRSDERIREDVSDRLTDDHYVDASDIEVSVSSCEVTLSGLVSNRDERRRAEDIAEHVSGVRHVQNNLRVRQQQSTTGTGTSQTTAAGELPTAANQPNTTRGRSSAA
jgi:osmotically-inducible protein OsmY